MAGLGVMAQIQSRPAIVDPRFWAGRRVLITGHSGFIGGWTAFWLASMGAEVTGFSLEPPTEPSFCNVLGLPALLACHIESDIRDAAAVRAAVTACRPEIVFHLAAQPLVRRAHREPAETFAINVQGTVNLLEALRIDCGGVRAVVCYTTDKVYENREWVWGYRESDALGGKEAYGASKAAAEHVISAYAQSYFTREAEDGSAGTAIAALRAGNVFGGGDWAEDRIVPDAIRAFVAAEPLVVRNPSAVRPWQHVLEPVRGSLILAQAIAADAKFGGAWNFGPNQADDVPVSSLADGLVRRWGGDASWTHPVLTGQPYEQRLLAVDSAKARADLKWRPAMDLDQALDCAVAWYQAHHKGAGPETLRTLTRMQIAAASPEVAEALPAGEDRKQAS